MKQLALRSALSTRASGGQIRVVEGFDWDSPKTKRAHELLQAIDAGSKVLVVLDRSDDVAYLSLRNLENVVINGQLNPYDVLWADTVVFTAGTLDAATGAGDYSVGDEDFVKEDVSTPESQVPSQKEEEASELKADSGESDEASEEESE